MSPPVQFPPATSPIAAEVLQIRLAQPPPGMSLGQILEVRVLERLDDGRLLIGAGETHLTAETEQALRPGQTLTMRVDSLRPRVVLSVLSSAEDRLIAEHLRGFRSNPAALTQSLAELAGVLGGKRIGEIAPPSCRGPLAAILDALGTVLSGRERIGEGFSLPDFARVLGLLSESDLKKVLEKPGEHPLPSSASLKASLMKILEESASEGGKTIREWTPVLEKAVRAIERLQVLNVHLQENEGKLLLQVPLLFAGLAGTADIFIGRGEGQGPGADRRNGAFRVLLALEMDALGDVMAQAHFSGNAVSCCVHCEGDDAASFVSGLLSGLEARLSQAGYRVADLRVRVDSRVRETMEAGLRKELHGDGQVLSVFA